ncbi:MAG TPA: MATE family efflux transporter [Acidimicrobiia bacterium]
MAIWRRDPRDGEILRLALPAFGALAAEPLYVLADTAIVGHLGTRPLAGLAVAGTLLSVAFGIFNFLAYATTAAVARRIGAGDRAKAAEQGIDSIWLAVGLGIVLTGVGLVIGPGVVRAMGASARIRPAALTYLRISLLGAPAVLVALAGTGYLRGCQDTRTPLVIQVAANVGNLALEMLLVFGLHLGIAGSAWGTVVAQLGAAGAYVAIVRRAARAEHASMRPDRAGIRAAAIVGSNLVVRTGALLTAFLVSTSVASRIGDAQVAAHEIAFQIWNFLALSLDAVAIAGQAIVGRSLGAGDRTGTRAAARRMIEWGVIAGLVLGAGVALASPALARVFSHDATVRHNALPILWIVAAMQPMNGVVFVLDGVLIGAGEARYLALAMLAATAIFVPAAAAVDALGGGLIALWGALTLWMVARLVGMGRRYLGDHWLVVGASRA